MKISLPNFSAFLESGSKWRVTIWWTQWTTLECASSSFVQFMSRYKCISSIPYAQSNICLFKARPSKNFSHLFCKHTAANTLFVSNLHFKRNFYNVKKTYLINWFCWKTCWTWAWGRSYFEVTDNRRQHCSSYDYSISTLGIYFLFLYFWKI